MVYSAAPQLLHFCSSRSRYAMGTTFVTSAARPEHPGATAAKHEKKGTRLRLLAHTIAQHCRSHRQGCVTSGGQLSAVYWSCVVQMPSSGCGHTWGPQHYGTAGANEKHHPKADAWCLLKAPSSSISGGVVHKAVSNNIAFCFAKHKSQIGRELVCQHQWTLWALLAFAKDTVLF